MRARIVLEAEEEANKAAQWYDGKEPGLGDEFLEELGQALAAIEVRAESFARLETIRSRKDLRHCLLSRFPYVVIFELAGEEAIIWAVAHGSQRPGYWRRRLGP